MLSNQQRRGKKGNWTDMGSRTETRRKKKQRQGQRDREAKRGRRPRQWGVNREEWHMGRKITE